jgi:hypothetical protein
VCDVPTLCDHPAHGDPDDVDPTGFGPAYVVEEDENVFGHPTRPKIEMHPSQYEVRNDVVVGGNNAECRCRGNMRGGSAEGALRCMGTDATQTGKMELG